MNIEDISNTALFTEIRRRFKDDEITYIELTEAVFDLLDYNARSILDGVRDYGDWSDEDLLGTERYRELTEAAERGDDAVALTQTLVYSRSADDLGNAIACAQRLLDSLQIFGPYDAQRNLL